MPNISLEEQAIEIYEDEIKNLAVENPKFNELTSEHCKVISEAFEYTMKHGKKKIRAQMLYDLFTEKINKIKGEE